MKKSKIRATAARISKAELARRARVSRQSVAKYLREPGAPKADQHGKFDAVAAAFFVGVRHARGTEPDGMSRMRTRKLELELEKLERTAATERGELIEKRRIEPTIAAVMALLTENLRNRFEFDLPSKYEGLTAAERVKLNADGVDWVLNQFKAGLPAVGDSPITPGTA